MSAPPNKGATGEVDFYLPFIQKLEVNTRLVTLKSLQALMRFFEIKGASESVDVCVSSLNKQSWALTMKTKCFEGITIPQLRLILAIFLQPEPSKQMKRAGLVDLLKALFDNRPSNPTNASSSTRVKLPFSLEGIDGTKFPEVKEELFLVVDANGSVALRDTQKLSLPALCYCLGQCQASVPPGAVFPHNRSSFLTFLETSSPLKQDLPSKRLNDNRLRTELEPLTKRLREESSLTLQEQQANWAIELGQESSDFYFALNPDVFVCAITKVMLGSLIKFKRKEQQEDELIRAFIASVESEGRAALLAQMIDPSSRGYL